MKVAFTGGRDFGCDGRDGPQRSLVEEIVLAIDTKCEVLVGDCPTGVDDVVWGYADRMGNDTRVFRADWDKHGKAAGPIRNRAMLDSGVDLLIAFPGGRGTQDCVRAAKERGIPVLRVEIPTVNDMRRRQDPR